jgi:transcription termination/antitermination protein NusA
VAVAALQPGIDPVGACVGVRGVRIQAIVRELNEEKIDVIEWNPDPAEYIAKALSPARVVGVFLDKMAKGAKTATVVVPEDQLSLAIGRDGQNARLAAKLTAWRIDIKSLPEAAADAIHKLQNQEPTEEPIEQEPELIAQVEHILAKKSEGRPITPEEYQVLTRFVVGAEKIALEQRQAEKMARRERLDSIRASIPKNAFETPLDDLGIPVRFSILLGGEGYSTVGDLMYQLLQDSDVILGLNGMGPKALAEIQEVLDVYRAENPVEEPEPDEVETTEAEIQAEPTLEAAEVSPMSEIEPTGISVPDTPSTEEGAEPMAVDDEPAAVKELEKTPFEGEASVETSEEPAKQDTSASVEISFDDWEAIKELAVEDEIEVDEEDDEVSSKDKKKKKGKKRHTEMEYDPDLDRMVVKRKHKREGKDPWMDNWD